MRKTLLLILNIKVLIFQINLKGLPFKIVKIEIDNEELDLKKLKINGDNSFVVTKEFNRLLITSK